LVHRWLLWSPQQLSWFVVWTKAFTEDLGERIITWHRDGMDYQWEKYSVVEPNEDGKLDTGAFF